uniref:3-dehydrosphinganine reductase n=1 Tax=Culicoides sonorensis TaxID=179676 RepID=A0A336MDM6_CULSO
MEITCDMILIGIGLFFAHLIVIYLLNKKTKDIRGRHVVVTGGSSGIGLWVGVTCSKLGANVTIVARNPKWLEKAKLLIEENRLTEAQRVETKSLDLSKNFEDVSKGFAEIEASMGPIYMLVNCAGFAMCGKVEDIDVADAKLMMDVNYFGTYYPTRYVLPKMREAQEGIIVITASQAALMGIYGYSAYAASKFALRGLAETIAMEAKQDGISVTLALPADTDTPGFERENKEKPEETKIISGSGGLAHPKDVGERIVRDALACNFFSILGFESWVLSSMSVGVATWNGPFLTLLHVLLLGPLRLVAVGLQWHCQYVIKKCRAKNKKD